MITRDHTLTAADGARLHARDWVPDRPPRAAVAIVHGYAEHLGRYDYAASELAARGYAVSAVDLRGHGKSEGKRVRVRTFNEYLHDADALLAHARTQHPDTPLFLLGHSMGGAVAALACVVRAPVLRGVVLSGAVLPRPRTGSLPSRLLARAGLQLAVIVGLLIPGLPLRALDAATVSRDPEVVARYDADPLVYRGKVPAGTAAAMVRAVRAIERGAPRITLPMLILHGTADQLASPEGSRWLYEHAGSSDRSLQRYDGLYHEILNEPERDRVIADIVGWIDARAAAGTGETSVAG